MPGTRAWIAVAALAALAMHSRPAGAEIDSKAAVLVDRYVQLSGGAEALAADTMLHIKAKVRQGDMRGTVETWWHGPTRMLEVSRIGPVKERLGLDGVQGWGTDVESRKVTAIEGKELEALQADAWFLSEQWARPEQGGGKVVLGQRAYSRNRTLNAIEATPPVGQRRTIWFDDESGLIARYTVRRDQYAWHEDVSEYRTLAGRKRALVTMAGDSTLAPGTFMRVNVDSIRAELPRDPRAFAPPASALRPLAWLKTKGVAKLPFRYERRTVWVRASLNGAPPADFILDTGASMTAIDRGYANQIELPMEGTAMSSGIGGIDAGKWGHVSSLRVAGPDGDGVELREFKVGVVRLQRDMQSLEWRKPAGLIGYDFLSRFVVDIDFDRQVLTLYDPGSFSYAGQGQALPMTLYSCIPTVPVELNGGCVGQFMVDVGNASVLMVHTEQVERCRLFAKSGKSVQSWVGGVGGAIPETVCRLDSIRLGPFAWNEPVVGLTLQHWGIAGSTDIQGNLGTSVLERFRCTFDYERRQLWLEPGARYEHRESFSRAGLWLERYQGVVMVVGVVRHSPGEKMGFKIRDAVKAVNGRPIERWTPEQLDEVLNEGAPGTVVTLTIERELVERDIEVTLADVL